LRHEHLREPHLDRSTPRRGKGRDHSVAVDHPDPRIRNDVQVSLQVEDDLIEVAERGVDRRPAVSGRTPLPRTGGR